MSCTFSIVRDAYVFAARHALFSDLLRFAVAMVFDSRVDIDTQAFFQIVSNLSKALLVAEERFDHLSLEVRTNSLWIHLMHVDMRAYVYDAHAHVLFECVYRLYEWIGCKR